MSDLLLGTPSHGRAKVVRPAKTNIQQFCADTGCSLEDLPGAIDNKDEERERVREIRAEMMMMMINVILYKIVGASHLKSPSQKPVNHPQVWVK